MLKLTFLGTGAACPTLDRNVASLALVRDGETLLFDCGEGTQRQMMRYGVSFALREIFFTHFHSDHLLGVIGLLRTMGLLNIFGEESRRDGLRLYGPKGAQRVLATRSRWALSGSSSRSKSRSSSRATCFAGATTTWSPFLPNIAPIPSATHWSSTAGWAVSIQTRRGSWAFPRVRSGARFTRASRSPCPTAGASLRPNW